MTSLRQYLTYKNNPQKPITAVTECTNHKLCRTLSNFFTHKILPITIHAPSYGRVCMSELWKAVSDTVALYCNLIQYHLAICMLLSMYSMHMNSYTASVDKSKNKATAYTFSSLWAVQIKFQWKIGIFSQTHIEQTWKTDKRVTISCLKEQGYNYNDG